MGTLRRVNLQEPITSHMRREVTQLRADQTVDAALAGLRQTPPSERIIYFYVVDAEGRLQGVVPTRRLLLSPPQKTLAEVMIKPVIAIPHTATVMDACEFFTMHRLLAFPVVDENKRILGAVDVDLYTDELSELDTAERNDALFQLIGVHLTEAQLASPLLAFRHRFPWLLCNIAAGILAAFLSGMFEAELAQVVALAMFIPVVLALAESVGIQAVSLALAALQSQVPTWKAVLGKAQREAVTGLLLGGASALTVATVAVLWLGDPRVMWCLLGGIAGGVTGATVVGFTLPNLLKLLKLDPNVAAGPITLASADMITLALYFNLARYLLQ